jgi:hypothetical protein
MCKLGTEGSAVSKTALGKLGTEGSSVSKCPRLRYAGTLVGDQSMGKSVKLVSYDEDQLVVLDSVGTVCDVATETGPPCSSFQDGAVQPYTVAL